MDDDDDDGGGTVPNRSESSSTVTTVDSQKQSAIDITAEDLIGRLTPQNVTDLVLLSMVRIDLFI